MIRNATFYTLFFTLLVAFGTLELSAQSACDESIVLPEAEKKYATGNFDEVLESLRSCIDKGFNEDGKVQAYKILVKTYLAIDSVESAKSAITRILEINPNFEPDFSASEQFKILVTEMKAQQEQIIQITSVSKKLENLLLVPATVMVITESDIKQRGYQSLEQILHDLPGFDIAKGNGPGYAYFYQRGYRSISNDRTLLLIDGVEENDLQSQSIPISRQYPLSDIERVEVIYGPASTIYGANAFSGVINIITRSGRGSTGTNKKLGFTGQLRSGTWNTRSFDGVLTAKNKDVSISLTGRYFRSDEMDLSNYPEWDYQANPPELYQGLLKISGLTQEGNYAAQNYINRFRLDTLPNFNRFFEINYRGDKASEISLSPEGRKRASELDNQYIFNNPSVGFNNLTRDWFFRLKVEFKDFVISGYSWRTNEGATPWYTDRIRVSGPDYSRWITANNALSIVYTKSFSDRLQILNITSYKIHEIDGNTNLTSYRGYLNQALTLVDLAKESAPSISSSYFYRYSNQYRNEFRLFWTPSPKLEVNSGLELRGSFIQGDYLTSSNGNPEIDGTLARPVRGANNYRSYDVGLYSQLNYQLRSYLKLVGGIRVDNNRIRIDEGYGTVFNPRLAAIYTRGKYIFKGIYATAFKDASYFQRYATTSDRRKNNPDLTPERVKNLEFSTNWRPNKEFSVSAVAYRAQYSGVVGSVRVPLNNNPSNTDSTTQFQQIGEQTIWGIQGEASLNLRNYRAWLNFTFTNPLAKENIDNQSVQKRTSDIANFMFNLGNNYQISPKLNVNVIANFVSSRKSGEGTIGSKNPITRFDPYLIFNTALTYKDALRGVSVQILVNNVTNKEYFVPGIREADGITAASRFPQERRYISLGLLFDIQ